MIAKMSNAARRSYVGPHIVQQASAKVIDIASNVKTLATTNFKEIRTTFKRRFASMLSLMG
ncbi:MAG: hypothetical protein EBR30_22000 [Cytophagia bacterium]|nr:hypothetical protein [Cytophagia bacterium]